MNLGIGTVAVLAPMYQACGPRQLRAQAINVRELSIANMAPIFVARIKDLIGLRAKALRPKQQPRIRQSSPVSR